VDPDVLGYHGVRTLAGISDPDMWRTVAVLAGGVIGIAIVGYAAAKGRAEKKRYKELEAEVDDIISREEIQLLRHRDLDAFTQKVNEIRAKKGQEAVPKEFLAKIQYNLMYALDESDF
jgi:hypothetical protein